MKKEKLRREKWIVGSLSSMSNIVWQWRVLQSANFEKNNSFQQLTGKPLVHPIRFKSVKLVFCDLYTISSITSSLFCSFNHLSESSIFLFLFTFDMMNFQRSTLCYEIFLILVVGSLACGIFSFCCRMTLSSQLSALKSIKLVLILVTLDASKEGDAHTVIEFKGQKTQCCIYYFQIWRKRPQKDHKRPPKRLFQLKLRSRVWRMQRARVEWTRR